MEKIYAWAEFYKKETGLGFSARVGRLKNLM